MFTITIFTVLLIGSILLYVLGAKASNRRVAHLEQARKDADGMEGYQKKDHLQKVNEQASAALVVNRMVKIGAGSMAALAFVILALNSYTTVDRGEIKVGDMFGKVDTNPAHILTEGWHLVNPVMNYTVGDIKDMTFTINDILVPAQDKLKSKVDVTFLLAMQKDSYPNMLQTAGVQEVALRKYLTPKSRSLLREVGKAVENSEDFFQEDTQRRMQAMLENGMREYLTDKGFVLRDVMIRDIDLPPLVKQAVEATKERTEQVNQQEQALEIADLKAQEIIKTAEANNLAASEDAAARKKLSEAAAYDIEVKSTAQAEGNKKIARSLSDDLIKYTLATRWNGVRSRTVMASDADVIIDMKSEQ